MNKTDQAYWVAASLLPKLSANVLQVLLNHFDCIKDIFCASRGELLSLTCSEELIDNLQHPPWWKVEKIMDWLDGESHHCISFVHKEYPLALKSISSPPVCLYIRGDFGRVLDQQVAIVGSRKPTPRGLGMAKRFSFELASVGLTVTSGLALGVDGAAHRGALAAKGGTVAVLGCGVDCVYPRRHRQLFEQILENSGAIVSEFPLGVTPKPQHFPRRNRIISGLSRGVLVVEAARKSGSLITADFAAAQGREVFAMPGDVRQPLAAGCHHLIQQGAKLVVSVADITEELAWDTGGGEKSPLQKNDLRECSAKELCVLSAMGNSVCTVDYLAAQCGLAFEVVCSMLLRLELFGHIKAVAGGYIKAAENE